MGKNNKIQVGMASDGGSLTIAYRLIFRYFKA
jgi:hypothetical protein